MDLNTSLEYDARVIDLAKHMHDIAAGETIIENNQKHNKKIQALCSAMSALSKIYHKPFNQVYEEVSEYAGWISTKYCIDQMFDIIDEPVTLSS